MSEFPVDETTLTLLAAACKINPDSGHSELMSFLDMTGGPIRSVEQGGVTYESVEDALEATYEETPILFIDHAPGDEPHSVNSVILALIAEIQRLRG